MTLKGILFDKDGTLIDFDRTWGPAAFEVMREMAGGDEAVFARLAEVNEFVVDGKALPALLAARGGLVGQLRAPLGGGAGAAGRAGAAPGDGLRSSHLGRAARSHPSASRWRC